MTSVISKQRCQDLEDDMGLGGVFTVEWLHKESLSFQYTQHIFNQWNDNKEVQISRDGQELDPQAGSQLLLLWDQYFGNQYEKNKVMS